jgi:hypothetical protein
MEKQPMKKRLEDHLPEVSEEALKAPLSFEGKKLDSKDQALLRKIQDDMKDRKNKSGSATQ